MSAPHWADQPPSNSHWEHAVFIPTPALYLMFVLLPHGCKRAEETAVQGLLKSADVKKRGGWACVSHLTFSHILSSFHLLKHGFTEIPHHGLLSRDKSDSFFSAKRKLLLHSWFRVKAVKAYLDGIYSSSNRNITSSESQDQVCCRWVFTGLSHSHHRINVS